jgi:hypothetical protein
MDEAGALLDQAAERKFLFNSSVWRNEVVRARLLRLRGMVKEASRHARSALALLEEAEPQLARHPDVGLITADRDTIDELRLLSAESCSE